MVRVILLLTFVVPLWAAPAAWIGAATAKDCVALEVFLESPAPDERHWSPHALILGSALLQLTAGESILPTLQSGGAELRPCWDSRTHAITLDFAGATVTADALSHLVTTPNLLPEFAHAGLTIRHAVVDGTLEIAHATIGFPLRFEDVAFPNPQPDARARDDKSRVAIRIEDSEFEQTFELSRSAIRGLVFVSTSSFRDGLRITGSDLTYPPAANTPAHDGPTAGDGTEVLPANAAPTVPPPRVNSRNGTSAMNGGRPLHARTVEAAKAAAPSAPACAVLTDRAEREALVARQGAAWVAKAEKPPRSLQIVYSQFEGLVQVQGNCFAGHVLVDHSGFKHVEFSRNLIAEGHLQITENEALKLVSKDNRYGAAVDMANNRVASVLDVIDDVIAPVPGTEPRNPPSYRLSVNTVGGSLWFDPAEITPAIPRLDLTYNAVVGPFDVYLPETCRRRGAEEPPKAIDLTGTEVQSRLRLAARSDGECPAEGRTALAEEIAPCHDRPEPPSTVISLANASTGTLIWNLPADCTYRWTGAGFEYGFIGDAAWTPDDGRTQGPATDATEAKPGIGIVGRAWAKGESQGNAQAAQPGAVSDPAELWSRMAETKNPDALVRLAHYLRSQGLFDRSRAALLEAKQQSYAPPSECSWASPSSYVTRKCVTGASIYGYLWLGGFGVAPERPSTLLLLVWLGGWLLYWLYHRHQSWRAAHPLDAEAEERIRRLSGDRGMSSRRTRRKMHGFLRYDDRRVPEDFRLLVFSLDAMLPVIDLHAYAVYFPRHSSVRVFSYFQHLLGWLLLTSVLAGLAVL